MKGLLLITMMAAFSSAQFTYTKPYNGGDQFQNMHSNPALMTGLLESLTGTATAACAEIDGVGHPVLSLKKAIQDIDTSLDSTHSNTYASTIFFKESTDTTGNMMTYKVVVKIQTFNTLNYLGVTGVYKKLGFPTFQITNYLFDTDIANIRTVLEDSTISENGIAGCGDVKSIYSQANPVLPNPNTIINGQQSNPSQEPYAQGNQIINTGADGQNAGRAQQLAALIQLLTQSN
jgi:hypothetical protein